jgi:hypothetical protein
MVKSLLKTLALTGSIAVSSALESKAGTISAKDVASFSSIIPKASENSGKIVTYSSNSITFTNGKHGEVIANNPKFSLIYFEKNGKDYTPIGGLDGFGESATGWFNFEDANNYGMSAGQTANYLDNNGNAGNNSSSGYWVGLVDLNNDGNYCQYDSKKGLINFDKGELIQGLQVSNFQPFQTNSGTLSAGNISGYYDFPTMLPEPSSLALFALGSVSMLSRRKK